MSGQMDIIRPALTATHVSLLTVYAHSCAPTPSNANSHSFSQPYPWPHSGHRQNRVDPQRERNSPIAIEPTWKSRSPFSSVTVFLEMSPNPAHSQVGSNMGSHFTGPATLGGAGAGGKAIPPTAPLALSRPRKGALRKRGSRAAASDTAASPRFGDGHSSNNASPWRDLGRARAPLPALWLLFL